MSYANLKGSIDAVILKINFEVRGIGLFPLVFLIQSGRMYKL